MPKFSLLSPLDQPLGNRRLLEDIKRCLKDKELSEFGFSVAFAKIGPLYRLQELIQAWRAEGKKVSGIFGIDHCGTSIQALRFALEHLDNVYYTQYRGHSFHPKIYWFKGQAKAIAFIGSNNLTMGGMELNFEAAIELEFSLPDELAEFEQVRAMFISLLPSNCIASHVLTCESLAHLDSEGMLIDEGKKNSDRTGNVKRKIAHPPEDGLRLPVKPSSSLPHNIVFNKKQKKQELAKKAESIKVQANVVDIMQPLVPVSGFVIQIKPHHNGEIFLSKTAAQQNPAFFGMPFTGQTIPKKGANEGYPQRTPDPICNIYVFGEKNKILFSLKKYPLNTVFYTTKSEIRVTASPLVTYVPEYSTLIITQSDDIGIDYEMQIFTPNSPDYAKWVAVCNQTMPSGGKEPRRFGWF